MREDDRWLLYLLGVVLVEIRALGTDAGLGGLELGPRIANIVHNVPAALALHGRGGSTEDLCSSMRSRAAAIGLNEAFAGWEAHAKAQAAQSTSHV